MTTDVTSAPASNRPDHLFGRAYRATGYCRIGFAPFAVGLVDGVTTRAVLPVEAVVAVDARTRPGGKTTITAAGADGLVDTACAAAQYLVDHHGLSGEIRLTVRHPYTPLAEGLIEATAGAVVDALAKAEELGLSPRRRAEIVAAVVPDATGLALGSVGLVTNAGRSVSLMSEPARLTLVIASIKGHTEAAPAELGTLTPTPSDVEDAAAVAQWLSACSGAGSSEVHAAVSALQDPAVLAVIGGHSPTAPVALVLADDPESLRTAQRLTHAAQTALSALPVPPGVLWRVSLLKSVAPSASA